MVCLSGFESVNAVTPSGLRHPHEAHTRHRGADVDRLPVAGEEQDLPVPGGLFQKLQGRSAAAVLAVTTAGYVRTRVARVRTGLSRENAAALAALLNRNLTFVAPAWPE